MQKDTCKHKVSLLTELCHAGVDVRKHVGGNSAGWGMRRPCDADNVGSSVRTCTLYEEATQDELDEDAKLVQEAEERFKLVVPVIQTIKENNKGRNNNGTVTCPVCKGKLNWIHAARNGHVHGKCETTGCLAWME